ncbi:MAG: DNA repair protein RadC [Bacteroidales bacterium]|jgi:DNA repair protein RadC|nr:DNA repair protein RadC [Bacteroidales bacterium]
MNITSIESNPTPIKYWPDDERPREKLMKHGAATLSNAELLAIIINNGNKEHSALGLAKNILATCDHNFLELSKTNFTQLTKQFKGIGPAKAVTILATLEIGRRRHESRASERPRIQDSRSAFEIFFKDLCDLNHEEFWVLYLNAPGHLIAKQRICEGGISQVSVDVKKIMQAAIAHRAIGLVLGHNHPSGNTQPSNSDLLLTQKIQSAAKILDLRVIDHIILSGNDYYSFGDDGAL